MAKEGFVIPKRSKNRFGELQKKTDKFVSTQPKKKTVSYYQKEITKSWHKTVEGILETASLVAEAEDRLDPPEWEQLKNGLPFGDSVRSMMLGIGKTNRFGPRKIQKLLPPNYNILYEYSTLENAEWSMAVDEGIVDTDITTTEVRKWKQDVRLGGSSRSSNLSITGVSSKFYAVVPNIDDLTDKEQTKVKGLLDALQKKLKPLGSDVVFQATTTATYRQQQIDKKRDKLKGELEKILGSHLEQYNQNISFREMEQIESAYYQYRYHQDHDGAYPYAPPLMDELASPDDIRHPDNPFGEVKMGFSVFMKWVRDKKVITQWTPIRQLADLGEAKSIKLALEHTTSNNHNQRSNYKRQLNNIYKRKGANSKFAKKYLDMLIEG
jgi:hypothetical protein